MSKKISIDPITRLEGHGKIDIFLDDENNVENAYLIIPELRGFESFCLGRPAEDMPNITNRICGVCPEAHHLASVKALDGVFNAAPTETAKKIRELLYMAFYVTDHTTHFYALGGPDFIVGPDAPSNERNIFGVIRKVGLDIANEVIGCRKRNHEVIKIIGGRAIHPTAGLPGGWSKSITKEEREFILKTAEENIKFALFSLKVFNDIVLTNKSYLDLILSDTYLHKTYYIGLVDENNAVNFYDGKIRVIDPEGNEFTKYSAEMYMENIAEHIEPYTYLKFPYLKKIGWRGFKDGKESGVYVSSPLSRLNVSDKITTPRANEHYEILFNTFQCKKINGRYEPVHHRLATHWARLIELLYAAERMHEIISDDSILSTDIRNIPKEIKGEGVGCVEAPRGLLTHHYKTDKNGILTMVNLIVGTTNNYAPISMSIKNAAKKLILKGNLIKEETLNKIEMAFRLYDPCMSCATHNLPGKMPLIVSFYKNNVLFEQFKRN